VRLVIEGRLLKIAGLGYVVIGALDIERWRRFGVDMLGMMAIDGPDGALYLKMDDYHHRYLIVPHSSDVFLASGWQVADQAAYAAALAAVAAAKVAVEAGAPQECALRKVQAFFRCSDPSGNRLEIFWGPIGDFARFVSPIGVSGFVTGDMGMGHVVLPAPQFEATRAFWLDVLNFGLSDFVNYDMGAGQSPVRINFMHCDNPREHSVALVEMANPCGCDHLLVEVQTIDEVGRALYRAEDLQIPLQVTLGRHINDDMISFYAYSPTGFTVEYGAGGKRIEDWSKHKVFEATRGSHWGHRFVQGSRSVE
jgi:3,4-dihydroxy-9,10-secoandrosta-1,3,5(10)-triene-9,17-dione 4,5-dioxygenase